MEDGAGIYVFSSEPPTQVYILQSSINPVITPYIDWATLEVQDRFMDITGENLKAFLLGKPQNEIKKFISSKCLHSSPSSFPRSPSSTSDGDQGFSENMLL